MRNREMTENLGSCKFVFDAMTVPVGNFIIGYRIFDIAAGRGAGFATLMAKLIVIFYYRILCPPHLRCPLSLR
jgi:hypothetical protein